MKLRLPRAFHWPRGPRRPRRRRRRWTFGAALLVLLLAFWQSRPATWPRAEILEAIRFVEGSGRELVPDGDGGLAIGPYQIHRVYWQDAVTFAPELGGDYQDCRRREYAERVVDAYMRRWAPAAWAAGDAETIARTHNGGPQGLQNPKTNGYWARVRARLR